MSTVVFHDRSHAERRNRRVSIFDLADSAEVPTLQRNRHAFSKHHRGRQPGNAIPRSGEPPLPDLAGLGSRGPSSDRRRDGSEPGGSHLSRPDRAVTRGQDARFPRRVGQTNTPFLPGLVSLSSKNVPKPLFFPFCAIPMLENPYIDPRFFRSHLNNRQNLCASGRQDSDPRCQSPTVLPSKKWVAGLSRV